MPEAVPVTTGLAFLIPLGYALIAAAGRPAERTRHAAVSLFAALGLSALGYLAIGFALQFGGAGLAYNRPGLEGLVWEWSALGPAWGTGWGMAGLTGWALTGAAATPGAYALALANLPWVVTATLIPTLTLRERVPAGVTALLGLLMGAVLYPLAGNWIWGGGWLANLGSNLGLGHGLVDAGGAGLVHLLGAAAALAGLLVFTSRKPRDVAPGQPVSLPPTVLPLLTGLGAVLLLAGSLAWTTANPLPDMAALDPAQIALNWALAAAAGALIPLAYTWLVAGTPDALMAGRGLAGGTVAIAAAAPFVPPWSALLIGALVGLLTPFAVYLVDHVLRWDDPAAVLTVHGLAGALGLLTLGLFADGRSGLAWNGIGVDAYLGMARQGVTGLLAGSGLQADWPGQMQAQAVGVAALALFGFFAAWLALGPLAILTYLFRRPAAGNAQELASGAKLPALDAVSETEAGLPSESASPDAPSPGTEVASQQQEIEGDEGGEAAQAAWASPAPSSGTVSSVV